MRVRNVDLALERRFGLWRMRGFAEFVVGLGRWREADTGVGVCMNREWLGIFEAIGAEDGVGVGASGEQQFRRIGKSGP